MSDTGHTALPWKIGAYGDICYGAGDWSGVPLHTGWAEEAWRDDATAKANAAYIVTACNALPILVEALEQMLFLAEADHTCLLLWNNSGSGADYDGITDRARAALASIKGGQ